MLLARTEIGAVSLVEFLLMNRHLRAHGISLLKCSNAAKRFHNVAANYFKARTPLAPRKEAPKV